MLRTQYEKKLKKVSMKSGGIYTFDYNAWENDPRPVIIFMYAFSGTHPKTKREWRFFQAINFTYIPRAQRRLFATTWISQVGNMDMFKRGNVRFTWKNHILRKYPYLKPAVRRYMYSPAARVTKLKEIPFEKWEEVIVSTMAKDFSKKIKTSLIKKFRNAFHRRGTGLFGRI